MKIPVIQYNYSQLRLRSSYQGHISGAVASARRSNVTRKAPPGLAASGCAFWTNPRPPRWPRIQPSGLCSSKCANLSHANARGQSFQPWGRNHLFINNLNKRNIFRQYRRQTPLRSVKAPPRTKTTRGPSDCYLMPRPATAASPACFPSRGVAPPPSLVPARNLALSRSRSLWLSVRLSPRDWAGERSSGRESVQQKPSEDKGGRAAAAAALPSSTPEMFSRRGHTDVKKSAQKALDLRKEPLTRLKHLRALMGEWRGESTAPSPGGGGGLKDRSGVGGGRLRCDRVSPASCTSSWQLLWSS